MPRLTTRIPRVLLAALLAAGPFTLLDAPAAYAATHQVVMSGYAFAPRALTITAGDTVTWVNQDTAPHDVKTTSGPESLHSPMLNKGGTWSHTFTTAGSYGYVCTVHPGMTAQLVVKAAAPKPTTQAPSHQHTNSPPSKDTSPRTHAPAATPAPTDAGTSSAAAAPAAGSGAPSPTASPAATSQPQAPIAAGNAGSALRPLDPLLVLAGIVAGVAVLCLLLVGSRSAAATTASAASAAHDGGPDMT